MPKRFVVAAYRSFNAPAVRYPPDPRALFILAMCVVSGIPLITAHATPGSIEAQIDEPWLVVAWGVMLTAGAALTLFGAMRQTVNGVIIEQVGSIALAAACLIFAVAIWLNVRWEGSVVMFLVAGFGLASLVRWGQLQAYLHAVEHLASEIRGDDE